MKHVSIILFTMFLNAGTAFAQVKVITTYGYIADITGRIGKARIAVEALAPGNRDPHFIPPRPSFMAKARKADLVIINGGELEIGWLPPIIRDSHNPAIQPGQPGFLDLSNYVDKIQVPEKVSRSQGDVHPSGNPHYLLDPYNIPKIAGAVAERLCRLDPGNCLYYRTNLESFKLEWREKTAQWDAALKPLRGARVIQYHKLYDYFCNRYGIIIADQIEPLPGIPPTSRHLEKLINTAGQVKIAFILQDVYHSQAPSRFISGKTGIKTAVLPHDVGAVPEAKDIFSLFDEIVRRLNR